MKQTHMPVISQNKLDLLPPHFNQHKLNSRFYFKQKKNDTRLGQKDV